MQSPSKHASAGHGYQFSWESSPRWAVAVIAGIPGDTEQQYRPVSCGPRFHIALEGTVMSSQLHLDVFVPCKPPAGQIAPMGKGQATGPVTCVSLICGEHDAVLIDAGPTAEDGGPLVNWIRATGKHLTTICITPGHGDHVPGLNTILAAFSAARAGTTAAVAPEAQGQASPACMQFPTTILPGQIPAHPAAAALDGDVIDLDGQSLSGSRSARQLADTIMAVTGDPGSPYMLRTAAQVVLEPGPAASS